MGYGVMVYALDLGQLERNVKKSKVRLTPAHFEKLCRNIGNLLDNGCWSAMRSGWFDEVDKALAKRKAPQLTRTLFHRGVPFRVVDIVDFPVLGHVTVEEAEPLADALRKAIASNGTVDVHIASAVEQVISWCDRLQASKQARLARDEWDWPWQPCEAIITFYQ